MSQPLPTRRFRWVDVKPNEIQKLAKRKDRGYLLKVDVSYLKDLQDSHNDLSFMYERMRIDGVEKLVPNLCDKKNYVIQIPELSQALKHGLVPDRIHRAIEFDQSAWMKPYIDFNTQLRTQARNDFEKDFFSLMNNSVFGKAMEDIIKHRALNFITNRESYLKAIMKPNFRCPIWCCDENAGLSWVSNPRFEQNCNL